MGFCPSGVCAVTWNANGLLGKIDDLREFISRTKPDILLIQETWLAAADNSTVPNYTLYSTPSRTYRRCRGTAILIKNTIRHQHLPNPTLRYIEATMVIVNLPNTPLLISFQLIGPPKQTKVNFTLDFESIYAYNSAIYISGNLNAKHRNWNCMVNCKNGKLLVSFAGKTNAKIIAPDKLTHFHCKGASVLDLDLARNILRAVSAYSLNELSSDHLPVKFLIDTGTPVENPKKFFPNWRKYKSHLLRQTQMPPSRTEEIDAEVERLTAEIITAFRESGSWRELIKSEATDEINQQVRERNKCKKTWQKTRHSTDKNKLNRAQSYLRKLYRDHNEKKMTNLITGIEPGDDTLWKLVKTYMNERIKMPPTITDSQVAYEDIEKAEAIADSLALQFQNNDLSHPPRNSS
ncbi:putative RNA-directed DNA polymerase from transposon X-element [Araneus ventricosus]|uniref:Putative RNA-directed DNA polymerase from transposon X-element n=1 Tax=Araneus ventricosus TaxID=182803 RepID=A0A4Y2AGZ2_ARAVE|nr:putative RNA-directed DNA polymerase from transposon X-element [Araneus ventricosus]